MEYIEIDKKEVKKIISQIGKCNNKLKKLNYDLNIIISELDAEIGVVDEENFMDSYDLLCNNENNKYFEKYIIEKIDEYNRIKSIIN